MEKEVKSLLVKISVFVALFVYALVIYIKGGTLVELSAGGLVALVTALFWLLIDHKAWKWPYISSALLAKPDISGFWDGEITREGEAPHKAEMEIRQSWLTVHVLVSTGRADSTSVVAKIVSPAGSDGFCKLIFVWNGDAKPNSSFDGKGSLWGTTILNINEAKKEMSGIYFTNMEPTQTKGVIKFKKRP